MNKVWSCRRGAELCFEVRVGLNFEVVLHWEGTKFCYGLDVVFLVSEG